MRHFILTLLLVSVASYATPPDNRPPDNRPPDFNDGDVTTDVTTDVNTNVDTTVNAGDLVGGDTNVSHTSRALALGNSLGDVDINDCLASTQWGTPVFSRQNVVLNKWCAAEVYDAKGLHRMAAKVRCEIKEIAALSETREECIADNTVQAPPVVVAAPPTESVEREDEDEEVKEKHNDLEARIAAIEKKRAADARRASAWAEEQKRAREEQKMLAQQSLDALQEYRNE